MDNVETLPYEPIALATPCEPSAPIATPLAKEEIHIANNSMHMFWGSTKNIFAAGPCTFPLHC